MKNERMVEKLPILAVPCLFRLPTPQNLVPQRFLLQLVLSSFQVVFTLSVVSSLILPLTFPSFDLSLSLDLKLWTGARLVYVHPVVTSSS